MPTNCTFDLLGYLIQQEHINYRYPLDINIRRIYKNKIDNKLTEPKICQQSVVKKKQRIMLLAESIHYC